MTSDWRLRALEGQQKDSARRVLPRSPWPWLLSERMGVGQIRKRDNDDPRHGVKSQENLRGLKEEARSPHSRGREEGSSHAEGRA